MSLTMRPVVARRSKHAWLKIFLIGLALWLACIAVTLTTKNINLVPTLILLGSFLVPVSFVAWAFEHWRDEHITTELIVSASSSAACSGCSVPRCWRATCCTRR